MVTIRPVTGGLDEGNYTSWTYQWIKALHNGDGGEEYIGYLIDEENGVLHIGWIDGSSNTRYGVYNLSDASTVFQSSSGSNYTSQFPDLTYYLGCGLGMIHFAQGGGFSTSLLSYVLLLRENTSGNDMKLEVWRGNSATPVWSHDVESDCSGLDYDVIRLYTAAISVLGGYIVVVIEYTKYGVGAYRRLLCYAA